MRTIPAAISTGLGAGTRMFYLVRLTWRDGAGSETTKYFPTAGKNLAGNAMTLKETSGGASLTYDASVIAGQDWSDGQPSPLNGIGEFEQAVDLTMGGGVAQMSDGTITLLNPQYSGSNRFDTTVLAAPTYLENATVKIYLGFIPAGASPTVVIADDMLLRWSGVVEDASDFDHKTVILRCVDGTELRHKEIPTETVAIDDYPRCPRENLGRAIPLLYGDFTPGDNGSGADATESTAWTVQDLCPAPGIMVDFFEQKFVFASHACHTFSGRTYEWGGGIECYGGIFDHGTSRDTFTYTRSNTSAGCFITYRPSGIGTLSVEWRQPARFRHSDTTGGISDTNFAKTIDRDVTTSVVLADEDVYAYNMDSPYGSDKFRTDTGEHVRGGTTPSSDTLFLRMVVKKTAALATGDIHLFWDTNAGVNLSDTVVTITALAADDWPLQYEEALTDTGNPPILDSGYISENTFGIYNETMTDCDLYGVSIVYFTGSALRSNISIRFGTALFTY